MPNHGVTDSCNKYKPSDLVRLSAIFFSLFLMGAIFTSNLFVTILFYRMVSKLYPTTTDLTSNISVAYNSTSSIYATNARYEVQLIWIWAIFLVLVFPQIYTILSCLWRMCIKNEDNIRRNSETNDDSNTINNGNRDNENGERNNSNFIVNNNNEIGDIVNDSVDDQINTNIETNDESRGNSNEDENESNIIVNDNNGRGASINDGIADQSDTNNNVNIGNGDIGNRNDDNGNNTINNSSSSNNNNNNNINAWKNCISRKHITQIIVLPLRAATWTFFIYWCLPRFNAMTGFSAVVLYQSSLFFSSRLDKNNFTKTLAVWLAFVFLFLVIIAVILYFSWNITQDTIIIGIIILAIFILFVTVLQGSQQISCSCQNEVRPESNENGSYSEQKPGIKFFILVSIIQVIFMFCSVFGAFAVYCEPPHNLFFPVKCSFKDYDIHFTKDGDVTEALASAALCIVLSFVCFKLCYYACAINAQFSCCFVPLLLSTFVTVVAMACFSIFQCSLFGYIILPYRFNKEVEMIVQICLAISAVILVIIAFLLFVRNHPNNQAKRMENQESLFCYPYYESFGVGISIINSRISKFKDLKQNATENRVNSSRKRRIYVCSTMMHEDKEEMKTLVSSILRLQQNPPMNCTCESHIIFDNAFIEEEPNEYVKRLENIIENEICKISGTSSYQKIEYPTPYGSKYEYLKQTKKETLSLLCVHLKNKNKIRTKKRWSQVMYMHFFLRKSTSGEQENDSKNCYILTLDGDVDFEPKAVERLKELLDRDDNVGAACGRIFPKGRGPMIWYQKFEYAASHWLQKSTEHVFGCCLCSPGCFSLFRGSALNKVLDIYSTKPESSLHHIQYDLGEDRWLCTLLLKEGYKVEYMSAATAKTFAPQSFLEFCKQRRRWTPSTLANILDVIYENSKEVRQKNPYINKLYLLYQTYLLMSSIVTPGTIFLVILGALVTAFPELPLWVALLLNVIPVAILMIICVITDKDEIPIYYSGFLSTVYSLLMIVLLIGLIIEAKQSDFCSISTFFFAFVVGVFFFSALLHPTEFKYLFYGAMYFFAVPAVSMILVIYILGSLHILRWGTREKRSDYVLDDDKLSLLDRCCGRQRDERGADEYLLLCNDSNSPVGRKIEIRCNRRVPPYCNVVWKKDAREINNNDRRINIINYGFPKLVINNAKISDSGSYTCDVTQISGGQIEFKSYNLTVKGKKGKEAVRLTTASGYDTIVEGHDDDIVCKISENIQNKIIWKKDSTIINNQFITQNTYSIKEATKSDAGTYSCEVIFQPFKDSITIRRLKVKTEENCINIFSRDGKPDGSDKISVVWKVDDKTIDQFGDVVKIDNETDLKIEINRWNKDKFNVSCAFKSKTLIITDKFEVCKQNEKFKITDKSYKRILKSTRTMFTDSEIKWKENDINIEDIQEVVTQQKKKTGNVTITEPKKKKCRYTCAIKHQPKSDSIAIEIVKPELTMEGPDLMLLNLTKTEEIVCISTARDWDSVEWKKDNCVIKKEKRQNNRQENELEGQIRFSYKIENAKQTDAGRYTCKVETTMGTVLEASKSIGCKLDSQETKEWDKLIKDYLSPDEESFQKQKEVHEMMLTLRNHVYFLFFLINALFVTSIFMMTQVNEFKGNIQISIPCPNKDGMFEVEPISMIFIFTFGLTLLIQLIGMVIHRFNTFLHLAYDIFSWKGGSQTAQRNALDHSTCSNP